MKSSARIALLVAVAAFAVWSQARRPQATPPVTEPTALEPARTKAARSSAPSGGPATRVVERAVVKSYGKVVHRGAVELGPTIDRILRGERHPHRNDGSVFRNRERRLPKKPKGYYREYVHPTPGVRGAGPQRIVRGRGDEWYYTPDHYSSFIPLRE